MFLEPARSFLLIEGMSAVASLVIFLGMLAAVSRMFRPALRVLFIVLAVAFHGVCIFVLVTVALETEILLLVLIDLLALAAALFMR